jgi:hypothetical protein
MNKQLAVIMPLVLLSTFTVPALATSPPQYGYETTTHVDYKGHEAIKHSWDVVYNSDYYEVNIYNWENRLYGWEIKKNKDTTISERDFVSDSKTNPPLCSNELISYFDYKGFHVKEHKWLCVYDNNFYVVKIYTEDGKRILLGWQIFKNSQLISIKSFI